MYANRVAKIKELMPHCCIVVDVIVGFPGETREDFIDTYNFLNNLDIYHPGVEDVAKTAELSKEYRTSFYDMLYAVVAKRHKTVLITAISFSIEEKFLSIELNCAFIHKTVPSIAPRVIAVSE